MFQFSVAYLKVGIVGFGGFGVLVLSILEPIVSAAPN